MEALNGDEDCYPCLSINAFLATTVNCRTPTPAPARSTHHQIRSADGLFHSRLRLTYNRTRTQPLIPPPSLFSQVHSFPFYCPQYFIITLQA